MLAKYRELEKALMRVRRMGEEAIPEEDSILDQMDVIWYKLSENERAQLDLESAASVESALRFLEGN